MNRTAVIDPVTKIVAEVIELDEASGHERSGFILVPSELASTGDAYDAETGTFSPPPVPIEDRKADLKASINARRDRLLSGGFTVPTAVSTALGGQVLQTRDAEDKSNWQLSQSRYVRAVSAGNGNAKVAAFRTLSNATIVVSVAEGLAVLDAMQDWGTAVMVRSWALKDSVERALDATSLDAIDITSGWPE